MDTVPTDAELIKLLKELKGIGITLNKKQLISLINHRKYMQNHIKRMQEENTKLRNEQLQRQAKFKFHKSPKRKKSPKNKYVRQR